MVIVVGVNGGGKTTSLGNCFKLVFNSGQNLLL